MALICIVYLALMYGKPGRQEEATQLRLEVLEIYERVFGSGHRIALVVMNETGRNDPWDGREVAT